MNIIIYYSDITRPKQNLRLSWQRSKKPDYCAACIPLCISISYLFVLLHFSYTHTYSTCNLFHVETICDYIISAVVYNSMCVSMYVTFGLMTFADHGAHFMRPNMLLKFTSILFYNLQVKTVKRSCKIKCVIH